MIFNQYLIFGLLLLMIFMSCEREEVSPMAYAKWIEDEKNGLHQSRKIDQYIFKLEYKPIDYIVAMRERTPKVREEMIEQAKAEMGDMEYFNFKLSTLSGQPALSNKEVQIENKDLYLISDMQKDLFLLEGKDTLHCRMFHFEGANGILPYDNCVLAFDAGKQPDKDKVFLFRGDKLGFDWIKIPIKAKAIKNIPKMKTY